MPSFDITLVSNREIRVGAGETYIEKHIYIIPDRAADMNTIIAGKSGGRVPVITRYRIAFGIKWLAPQWFTGLTYQVFVVDRRGEEHMAIEGELYKHILGERIEADEEADVTGQFMGKPSPMGLHALKLVIRGWGWGWWDYPLLIKYLRVYGTWGW